MSKSSPSHFPLHQLWLGARRSGAMAISVAVFGALFGSAALSSGLTETQAVLMSLTVFAGSVQFASLEVWGPVMPLGAILLTSFLVASRHILLGVDLAPAMGGMPAWKRSIAFVVLTDVAWAQAKVAKDGEQPAALYLGSALALYATWAVGTVAGVLVAGGVPDWVREALGYSGVIFLSLILLTVMRSQRGLLAPVLAAGGASMLLDQALPTDVAVPIAVFAGASVALLYRRLRRAGP